MANESRDHGDLLVGNFNDAYRNLTLKILMGMAWATDLAGREDTCFFIFTDDDVFISIQRLAR